MSRPIPVSPEKWGEMVLALSEVRQLREENARLKAEVERLRKAGDELSWAFAFAVSRDDGKESGLIKAWRAAKEGKPSV